VARLLRRRHPRWLARVRPTQLLPWSPLTAVAVSLAHSAAMIRSGLGAAWIVYRFLGRRALRAAWFDLDAAWAIGLIASGAAAIAMSAG